MLNKIREKSDSYLNISCCFIADDDFNFRQEKIEPLAALIEGTVIIISALFK